MPPLTPTADNPVKVASRATNREYTRSSMSRPRTARSRPLRPSSDAHTQRLLDRLVAEHARTFNRSRRATP
jgi:hypothetical protein